MRNYDKLVELYGKDRSAEQSSDRRKLVKLSKKRKGIQNSINIEDIDNIIFENNGAYEDYDTYENENGTNDIEDVPAMDTPTSETPIDAPVIRAKKPKQVSKENLSDVLDRGLSSIAAAINNMAPPLLPANELWSIISRLGLEVDEGPKAYMALIRDRALLTGFLGFPPERRKEFVISMVLGGN